MSRQFSRLVNSRINSAIATQRGTSAKRTAVVSGLAFLVPALCFSSPQTLPGSTVGTFEVLPSGASTYTVPVDTPPGVKGVVPNISLNYNSKGSNGLAGVGWSITGLSQIHRCKSRSSIDDDHRIVDFQDDYYCLDGVRLVSVSGNNGADNTIYHPFSDPLVKVQSRGQIGGAPVSFKVWNKNGQILHYGDTDDSRIEIPGQNQVRLWALNKVSDRNSNYMTVEYFEDTKHGEYFPIRYSYTGNVDLNLEPTNHVLLKYENRPDPQYMCQAGALLQTTQRLKTIETFADGGQAKSYSLRYLDTNVPVNAIRVEPDSCNADSDYSLVPEDLQARYDELQIESQTALSTFQSSFSSLEGEIENIYDTFANDQQALEQRIALLEEQFTQEVADANENPWEGDLSYVQQRTDLNAREDEVQSEIITLRTEGIRNALDQLVLNYTPPKYSDEFRDHQAINANEESDYIHFKEQYVPTKIETNKELSDWYFGVAKHYQELIQRLEGQLKSVVERADYYEEFELQGIGETGTDRSLIERFVRIAERVPKYQHLTFSWNQYQGLPERFVKLGLVYKTKSEELEFASRSYSSYLEYLGLDSTLYQDLVADTATKIEEEYAATLAALEAENILLDSGYTTEEMGSDRYIQVLTEEYNFALDALNLALDERQQTFDNSLEELEAQLTAARAQYDALKSRIATEQSDLQAEIDSRIAALRAGYEANGGAASRLLSVTECADGDCYRPTVFEWTRRNSGWVPNSTFAPPTALISYNKVSAEGEGVQIRLSSGSQGDISEEELADRKQQKINELLGELTEQERNELQRKIANSGVFVDMNNDGLKDWVIGYQDSSGLTFAGTWLNSVEGWDSAPGLAVPMAFFDSEQGKLGEILDVDGNSQPDLVIAYRDAEGISTQNTWLNTNPGWIESPQHILSDMISVVVEGDQSSTGFVRGEFVDVNQDGSLDWVQSYTGLDSTEHKNILWNTSSGWQEAGEDFSLPGTVSMQILEEIVTDSSANPATEVVSHKTGTFVDLNLDGFLDWVGIAPFEGGESSERVVQAWIHTSDGWELSPSFGIANARFNLDSEGLLQPEVIPEISNFSTIDIVDLNGDQKPDWVRFYKDDGQVWRMQTRMNTGSGWVLTADHSLPVARFDDGGNPVFKWVDVNQDDKLDLIRSVKSPDGNVDFVSWLNMSVDYELDWTESDSQNPPRAVQIIDQDQGLVTELGQYIDLSGDEHNDWIQTSLDSASGASGDENEPAWWQGNLNWTAESSFQLPTLSADLAALASYARIDDADLLARLEQEIWTAQNADPNGNTSGNGDGSVGSAGDGSFDIVLETTINDPVQSSELVDINSDGYVDWIKSIRFSEGVEQRVTWLNRGFGQSGWSKSETFTLPAPISTAGGKSIGQLSDVNGDGYSDLVSSYINESGVTIGGVWLGSSSGWSRTSSYAPPFVFDDIY